MKHLIFCCCLMFSTSYTYSQDFRGGIKVGTNATYLIDNQSSIDNVKDNFKRGYGYQIGFEASYVVFDKIGLLGEIGYQNSEFSFVQNKIVDVLPNGQNTTNGLVNENIKINNGSINFGLSLLGRFDNIEISFGTNLGYLTRSTGEVERSFEDNTAQEVKEDLPYDFFEDKAGEEGAYWEQSTDSVQLFNRMNLAGNLAFRFKLIKNLGVEIKTNYGFGDIINDLSKRENGGFERKLDLLFSLKYSFPLKKRIRYKKEEEIELRPIEESTNEPIAPN